MIARRHSFGELPEVLAQVAALGGLELAAAFARAYGGRKVYVPRPENLDAKHKLAQAIAAEGLTYKDAQALCDAIGGGWVDVPFGPFAGAGGRSLRLQQAVKARLAAGETKAAIAEGCEISERAVYKIQARDETADPAPLPLFPDHAAKRRP